MLDSTEGKVARSWLRARQSIWAASAPGSGQSVGATCAAQCLQPSQLVGALYTAQCPHTSHGSDPPPPLPRCSGNMSGQVTDHTAQLTTSDRKVGKIVTQQLSGEVTNNCTLSNT